MTRWTLAAVLLSGLPLAASAQVPTEGQPDEFRAVVACRDQSDEGARLSCYDRAVAALDQAARSGGIVVSNRQQAREARRSLFGFPIPRFLQSADESGEEEVRELRGIVRSASETGFQRMTITLEEGGRWQTIDSSLGAPPPRAGTAVMIRRNGIGSYFLTVPGMRPVRARRVE